MDQVIGKAKDKKIITVPNLMSTFRLCLIPIIAWLYLEKQDYLLAAIIVIISGITDVLDGIIARKFNMTSNLGKVLDPIADKATQAVVIILLTFRFPLMLVPLTIGILKECFMAISGYMIIKRRGIVLGASWHGKAATFALTAVMVTHLVWYNINPIISVLIIALSSAMIALSLALYARRNFEYLIEKQEQNDNPS